MNFWSFRIALWIKRDVVCTETLSYLNYQVTIPLHGFFFLIII